MPIVQGSRQIGSTARPPLQTKGLILVRQPDESDESYAARRAQFIELIQSRHPHRTVG